MIFKPGDKVRCKADLPPGSMLALNKVYTIVSDEGDYVRLEGIPGSWLKTRFISDKGEGFSLDTVNV